MEPNQGVLAAVWKWRRLVRELARRDFRARYAGSLLGAAWAVLEPAVHFGLYWVVFDRLLGTRLAASDGVGPFALYLIAGMLPFMAFQEMLLRAVGLAREQAHVLRHVNVPVAVVVSGALLAVAARQGLALVIVVGACGVAGTLSLAKLPLLLVGLVLLAVAGWGTALVLFPVGAYLPDAAQAVSIGTTVLFFVTPIVYREAIVPVGMRGWFDINPLSGLVDLFRAALIGGPVTLHRTLLVGAVALVCAASGVWMIRRRALAVRDIV